jgi:hypothetical protein
MSKAKVQYITEVNKYYSKHPMRLFSLGEDDRKQARTAFCALNHDSTCWVGRTNMNDKEVAYEIREDAFVIPLKNYEFTLYDLGIIRTMCQVSEINWE